MAKTVYVPYRLMRDRVLKGMRKYAPKSIRKLSKEKQWKHFIGVYLRAPGATSTLDANILSDEEQYVSSGCRMYFPETVPLMEVLWKAKISATLEDLCLEDFPSAFSIPPSVSHGRDARLMGRPCPDVW
jgi:hypothetical protein